MDKGCLERNRFKMYPSFPVMIKFQVMFEKRVTFMDEFYLTSDSRIKMRIYPCLFSTIRIPYSMYKNQQYVESVMD